MVILKYKVVLVGTAFIFSQKMDFTANNQALN